MRSIRGLSSTSADMLKPTKEMIGSSDVAAGLRELGRQECLDRLGTAGIAHVIMSVDCIPVAFPVNVSVVDGDVVFATGPGAKLDAARRGDVVTVEADDVDRIYHTGWSVLVTGVAEVISDLSAVRGAPRLLTQAWMPVRQPQLVRVPSTLVSGRRLAWAVPGASTENDSGKGG